MSYALASTGDLKRQWARHQLQIAVRGYGGWGLLGCIIIALGSLSVGITPQPDPVAQLSVVGLLRTTTVGQGMGIAAILTGVSLLLAAWLSMGCAFAAGQGPRLSHLRTMIITWSLPLLITPPLFSRDLYSYAAQGTMAAQGYDIYLLGPSAIPGPFADSVDPLWITTPAPYGPLFLLLASAVTHISGPSVYLTVVGMRLLAFAAVVALMYVLPALARYTGINPAAALWLGVANPLTIIHFVSGGHNDALMVAFIVAGVLLALRRQFIWATLAITAASSIKIPAAVALAVVAALWARHLDRSTQTPSTSAGTQGSPNQRQPQRILSGPSSLAWAQTTISMRRLLLGFLVTAATALAFFTALTFATGYGFGWIAALDTPATVVTFLSPVTATGVLATFLGGLLNNSAESWNYVDLTRQLGMIATVVFLAVFTIRRRALPPISGTALILFIVVILSPVVQPWYLMWPLVLLAATAVSNRSWVLAGMKRPWLNTATLVMAGIVGLLCYSHSGISFTTHATFVFFGPLASLVVTLAVLYHSYAEQKERFGNLPVFTLSFMQPASDDRSLRQHTAPVTLPGPGAPHTHIPAAA